MSTEDPITKLLAAGKEKMGTAVQKSLLHQLSRKFLESKILEPEVLIY